jgi:two-component system, OmpR family, response regulator
MTPKILLVDDDEPIRLLITAICKRLKIDVDYAPDGEAAVAMIRRRDYDALLLDLMMPKQNGFEVLREVRACAPDLLGKTIIITAVSDATLRDFDGGGTLVLLRKPFEIADLIDALVACTACEMPAPRRVSMYSVQA